MVKGQSEVRGQLGALFTTGSAAGVPDHQLLERFIFRRDEFAEAAFAVLVARHGPMVLKLCRSILRDPHEADDAFQTTFMLLAAKAGKIGNRELLGNWLYGVSLRTAMKARSRSTRRRRHERRAAECATGPIAPPQVDEDLIRDLHRGIDALPQKYRAAVVLCHLEGMTREQAAELLHCPVSTVGVRLMRARERLKAWLHRRHRHFSVALFAAGLDSTSHAVVPAALAKATTLAAIQLSTGVIETVGAASAPVVHLMKEVQMSLFLGKLKIVGISLLVCGLFAAGFGLMAQPPTAIAAPGSDEEQVLDLERAWGDALVQCDAALMDRIVAYEMVGTDGGGHLWNKAEYVESVRSGAFKIESFELADVKVRVFRDAAVATGRSIVNNRSRSGFARGGARYTDTYVRRNGCWQCVAWQSLGIPDGPETQASSVQESSKPAEVKTIRNSSEVQNPLPFLQDPAKPRAEELPTLPAPSEGLNSPRMFRGQSNSGAESRGAPDPSESPKLPTVPPAAGSLRQE